MGLESWKKEYSGRITLPDIKVYCIDTIIYLAFSDQWNKIENSEIDLHKYAQWYLTKMQKQIKWQKVQLVFSIQMALKKIGPRRSSSHLHSK